MARSRQLVSITERIIYLRSIPVAAMLSPPVLNMIASYLRERRFAAGEMLMREGEPFDSMHLLIEGSLRLTTGGKVLGRLEPPQSLGFLGILAQSDGTSDAEAEVTTRTLELESDALLELLEDHFELLHSALDYFAQRLFYEMAELPGPVVAGILREPVAAIAAGRDVSWSDRLLFLREMRAFRRANLADINSLCHRLEVKTAAAGEPLWRSGEPPARWIIPLDGAVDCAVRDETFAVGPGTVLGVEESIAEKAHWFSLTCREPGRYLEGKVEALIDVFEDNPQIGLDFIAMLASDLLRALDAKRELGVNPLAVRREVSRLGAVPVGA